MSPILLSCDAVPSFVGPHCLSQVPCCPVPYIAMESSSDVSSSTVPLSAPSNLHITWFGFVKCHNSLSIISCPLSSAHNRDSFCPKFAAHAATKVTDKLAL